MDALTGQVLWNALPTDEFGSPAELALGADGNVVVAGVSRYGAGMVIAKLHRYTGAFLLPPVLLPANELTFRDFALDAEGNAVLLGAYSSYSGPAALSKVSTLTGLEIWSVTPAELSGSGSLSLQLAPNGNPIVLSTQYGAAFVAVFSGATGDVAWLRSVSPSGSYGGGAALGVDAASDVYLAYITSAGLTVERLAGSGGTLIWSSVASGVLGSPSMIGIDGAGTPVVLAHTSLYGSSQVSLRMAHPDGALLCGPESVPLAPEDLLMGANGDAVVVGSDANRTNAFGLSASCATTWGPEPLEPSGDPDPAWQLVAVDPLGNPVVASVNSSSYPYASIVTKLDGANGSTAWRTRLASGYSNNGIPGIAVSSSGAVYVANPDPTLSNAAALSLLSGVDGSVIWGPASATGTPVAMEVDAAGDLVVLRRGADAQSHAVFTLEKRSATTGALAWGPVTWHSAVQLDDVPTSLKLTASGDVLVGGTSKIAQNGGTGAVVLCYSGSDGSLRWGPIAFDDFGQGVGKIFVERASSGDVLVTSILGGSWSGYPVLLRRLRGSDGGVLWGPVAPVLPSPYTYSSLPWRQVADGSGGLVVTFGTNSGGWVTARVRGSDGGIVWSRTNTGSSSGPGAPVVDSDGNVAFLVGTSLWRVAGSDGTPLWTAPVGFLGLDTPGTLAFRGRDVIVAGANIGLPSAIRITSDLQIVPPPPGALVGACGQSFAYAFEAPNGTAPVTFAIASGSLPPGLTLTGGTLAGTPSQQGLFSFRLQVTDGAANIATRDLQMEIVDGNPYVEIVPIPAPGLLCSGSLVQLSVPGTYSSYLWSPGGQTTSTIILSPTQPITVGVTVSDGSGCERHGAITLRPRPASPAPVITAPASVPPFTEGLTASVPAHAGSTYAWSIGNGTITAGQGTAQITFTSGSAGSLGILAHETRSGDSCFGLSSVVITVRAVTAAAFWPLAPCRLLDTRETVGPQGGPALAPGETRLISVAGACGIPADAKALSANVTVVAPSQPGELYVWPGDLPMPFPALVSYAPGRVRALSAMVGVSQDGNSTVALSNQSDAPVNVVLDVSGAFR